MPSPIIQPQGYSPWGAPDTLGVGPSSTLTPGGGGIGGSSLSPQSGFQNSVSNRAMLSPLKMNAPPPPRRTASEVNVSGSTGSSVMPRRSVSPGGLGVSMSMSLSPDHSASSSSHSSHYGNMNANGIGNSNGMTTSYMSEEPGSMSTGRPGSVSPGPVMMAGSSPSGAGLTARRAGRKDD